MISIATFTSFDENRFNQDVNDYLEKIQKKDKCKVVDIKYQINASKYSAMIIFQHKEVSNALH